jgi:hypothetical protein
MQPVKINICLQYEEILKKAIDKKTAIKSLAKPACDEQIQNDLSKSL